MRDAFYQMFPNEEVWFRGAAWGPNEDDVALQTLRSLFEWQWARNRAEQDKWHPLFLHMRLARSFAELRSVGRFVAEKQLKVEDLRNRFQDPAKYLSGLAEFRVGVHLESLGAALTYRGNESGADWYASWGASCVAVEVKMPRRSQQSQVAEAACFQVLLELQKQAKTPARPADMFFCADPELQRSLAESKDGVLPAALPATLAALLLCGLPTPVANWTNKVDGVGTLEVKLTSKRDEPLFAVMAEPALVDLGREKRKVVHMLREAEKQLSAECNPIVIALDLGEDYTPGFYEDDLLQVLATHGWARRVAGIFLVGAIDRNLNDRNVLLVGPGHHDALAAFAAAMPKQNVRFAEEALAAC